MPESQQTRHGRLFGRDMLYVVVWSLQLITATVISPVLAHVLPSGQFGLLASAIALYQILSVLAVLGLNQALVLERAADPESPAARGLILSGVVIAFIVTTAMLATVALWGPALGFEGNTTLVIIVILWTFPGAVVQLCLAYLVAEDRLRVVAVVSFVAAVGGPVGGAVLLLTVHTDAVTYALAGVGTQVIAMVAGLLATRPTMRGLRDFSVTTRALRIGLPLALSSVFYFVLIAGDRIVIQRALGSEAVGRYQIGYTVGSAVILLLSFTNNAWTPRFAAVSDVAHRVIVSAKSRDELYRLLLPCILGVALGAPVVLAVVAPPRLAPDRLQWVVLLVALSAFAVAASGASGRLLLTARRATTIGVIACATAVLNLGLNLVLVPWLGIEGAAMASLLAYVFLACAQRLSLPRSYGWPPPPGRVIATATVVVLLAVGCAIAPQSVVLDSVRFVLAIGCVPWLLLTLRSAQRRLQAVQPAEAAAPSTAADPSPAVDDLSHAGS